jgi:hypothetical protein
MTTIRVDAAAVAALGPALLEVAESLVLMGDPAAERWALGPGETGPAVEELLGGWRRVRLLLGTSLAELGEAATAGGRALSRRRCGGAAQPDRR